MTTALETKAVVGRRVEFAYYRDQDTYLPGIITAVTEDEASLRIRLDGARSNSAVRADYEGLRYLDLVQDVPALPMGRFHPTARDFGGTWEGVPVCQFEDEDIVILTADCRPAAVALLAYCADMGIDSESLAPMETHWVVFEWQPEDDESQWLMHFAKQGDDMAIQIHYLPA